MCACMGDGQMESYMHKLQATGYNGGLYARERGGAVTEGRDNLQKRGVTGQSGEMHKRGEAGLPAGCGIKYRSAGIPKDPRQGSE